MGLLKAILIVYYGLVLLPVAVVRRLLGRDPLQINRPPDGSSFWLARPTVTDRQSYFCEASMTEGKRALCQASERTTDRGVARCLTPPLQLLAVLCAPKSKATVENSPSAADRDEDIPDEIYTLW
jgi:hypothetical protein